MTEHWIRILREAFGETIAEERIGELLDRLAEHAPEMVRSLRRAEAPPAAPASSARPDAEPGPARARFASLFAPEDPNGLHRLFEDATRLVLDLDAASSLPGDAALLFLLFCRYGEPALDRRLPIRELAGLLRIARHDGDDDELCWARLSRRVVADGVPVARAWEELGTTPGAGEPHRRAVHRLTAGLRSEDASPPHRRRSEEAEETSWLVSPLWYATVLCGMEREDLLSVLRLLPEEEGTAAEIAEALAATCRADPAREAIADYLTGESVSEDDLLRAVAVLNRESPEYVNDLVGLFEDANEQEEEWLALSREIGRAAAARPSRLVWSRGRWRWAEGKAGETGEALEEAEIRGGTVGGWCLERVATAAFETAGGFGFAATVPSSVLGLRLELPHGAASVHLLVSPEDAPSAPVGRWRLELSLAPESRAEPLFASVVDDRGEPGKARVLYADRPVEFRIAPPAGGPVGLLLRWTGTDGAPAEHREEIPLLAGGPPRTI